MAAPPRLWALALAFGAAGCPYVTRDDLEAQLTRSDEDGDGVSVGDGDCDDADPAATPGKVEVPYDGVDNDCVGGDLVDVDGDGFDVDADCDDTAPAVFPGAADPPYDGLDADCGGDHDYDVDQDGFVSLSADVAAVERFEASFGQVLPRGDCDDADAEVYPGASGEVWYDGIDTDCDLADDFDADGDGVVVDEDCLDLDDPAVPASARDVYPGAPDVLYDGVDADCDGSDDYDQDADGSPSAIYAADYPAYAARSGFSVPLVYDCDDADAATAPGALERLDGGVDQDCGGDGDGAVRLPVADAVDPLVGPVAVRFASADAGFVAALLDGDEMRVFGFVDDGAADLRSSDRVNVRGLGFDRGLSFGLDGGVLRAVTAGAAAGFSHVESYGFVRDAAMTLTVTGPALLRPIDRPLRSLSVDTWNDAAWSCGDDTVFMVDLVTGSVASTEVVGAHTCFAEGASRGTVCGDEGCVTVDVDGASLTPSVDQPRAGASITAARHHGVLLALVVDGALVIEGAAGPVGWPAVAGDAVSFGGEVFAAAVDDAGEAWLLVDGGAVALGFTDALDVAVEASADRVVVIVTTPTDAHLLHWSR
jgi:hypothetical protein